MVMAYYIPGKRGLEQVSELTAAGCGCGCSPIHLPPPMSSPCTRAIPATVPRCSPRCIELPVRVEAERPAPKGHLMRVGRSDSGAAHKVIVYDRRFVWIGSANSDARSRRINTEAGLLIDSEVLAERLLKGLEQDFSPQHSWRLSLDADDGSNRKTDRGTELKTASRCACRKNPVAASGAG